MMTRSNRRRTAGCAIEPSISDNAHNHHADGAQESELGMLSVEGLLRRISERLIDPLTLQMLNILSDNISNDSADHAEAEKRARSIVITGVDEFAEDL